MTRMAELKANPHLFGNAKHMADALNHDITVGGIFPNAANGDFNAVDEGRFKSKYCDWWPTARIVLSTAKIFTGSRIDAIIDRLIEVGDRLCGSDS